MIKCPQCKRGKKFLFLKPPKVHYNREEQVFHITMYLQCANCKAKLTPMFSYDVKDQKEITPK